ncbi:MAG: UbiX family flavin prenyltransferase [Candidatus Thermoplasmatota archaeon]|nr:UbiX family flavin prenyltransferase [Candidatus Thermoplasmatota archaeon]MBS3790932.1 UbiX family flavin prenyltransferase [Candidatus Thermoplasmatota archaeon]
MKLLLCITGASGVIYGERLLEVLSKKEGVKVELIVSKAGKNLLKKELDTDPREIYEMADEVYDPEDLDSPPSSGSSLYDSMMIVPCSMSSLSKIASGISDNLITRAAAVFLKENRKLILTPRETPMTTTWLKNMYELSAEGAIVLPTMPAFYHEPDSIDDIVNFVVGKILDSLDIDNSMFRRWENKDLRPSE